LKLIRYLLFPEYGGWQSLLLFSQFSSLSSGEQIMQTATEIASNLKNIRFYADKISQLARQQFDLDFKRGQEIGINSGPGSIRFDCLEAIRGACTSIEVYCDNIASNLESAIKQDKVLHTEDTEQEVLL